MKVRAFVFEDNDTLRSMMSSVLEGRGYEVMSFPDPGFCPMVLNRECPCPHKHACADIIITDINMPSMTGLEFLENRRQNGCKVKNRAVMSGRWSEEELDKARKLGCKIFEKPFSFADLGRWLEECEKRLDPKRKLSDLSRHELETESLRAQQGKPG
ncbi:MAG: response regulator [Proteobacteria bacterium]|nr:response regulator [Pseudomonadota bacterium]